MRRWTPVALVALLACATTLDPVPADPPTCPDLEPAPVDYDRKLYKHWTDADGDCQDARQEVLIRDSQVPVTFDGERQCRVATGQWTDPYSGDLITNPSLVDVDHIVALRDAHDSGGHLWAPKRRESFANSLEGLVASGRSTNRSKGSRGPDEWLPPLTSYRCQYIENWLAVKSSWELELAEDESARITYMQKICAAGQVPVLPQG